MNRYWKSLGIAQMSGIFGWPDPFILERQWKLAAKRMELSADWVGILAAPLTSYVLLGKIVKISMFQFP